MNRRIPARGLTATLLATAVALSACSSDSSDAEDNTNQISVLLDWNPNPDHLAMYTADHTGAYEAHGVDPKFIVPGNTADAAKEVSLGHADLAISYEADTILANAQGLDVISVGALIPTPLNSLITKASSGITEARDLSGRKVASSGLPSQESSMRFIAEKAGIDPESIEMPNVQQNLNQALLSDQVDAIFGAYPNIEGVELAEHTNVTILSASDLGLPESAELVVIANPTRLEQDAAYAERVRGFLAGTAEGQQTALKNSQVAVDALTPETKGAYDPEILAKMVDATVTILRQGNDTRDNATDISFGIQDPKAWSRYAEWMRDNGLIDTASAKNPLLDGTSAMTNEYLPR